MFSRLVRSVILGSAVFTLALTVGCAEKKTELDVAAPPPSNPNAQPEVLPNKRMPNAPPTMGGGPQTK